MGANGCRNGARCRTMIQSATIQITPEILAARPVTSNVRRGGTGIRYTMIELAYTPRSTLNSLNSLAGKGDSSLQITLMGRSPSTDSSITRPHAR